MMKGLSTIAERTRRAGRRNPAPEPRNGSIQGEDPWALPRAVEDQEPMLEEH
jgi:hypothetical protein